VKLPLVEGSIDNPVLLLVGANYLKKELMPKFPMWAKGPLHMLALHLSMHFFGNNMHAESIIKWLKGRKDLSLDTSEPAAWALARWHEQREAGKTIVKEHERAAHILTDRKTAKARRMDLMQGATSDAIENEDLNNTDMAWGTASNGLKRENELKSKMIDIFDVHVPKGGNSCRYKMLVDHVDNYEHSEGNLKGMKYCKFNEWMNGKRAPGNRIKANVLRAFSSFVRRYE